jgi:hypothetical protein
MGEETFLIIKYEVLQMPATVENQKVKESGVLNFLFILSKHGTKANIRSTKMANNRHAYNKDVLQSYWTSDGLPLSVVSRLVRKHIQTNSVRSDVTRGLPDLGKSFTLLVCMCFLTSRLTTLSGSPSDVQ